MDIRASSRFEVPVVRGCGSSIAILSRDVVEDAALRLLATAVDSGWKSVACCMSERGGS